MEPQSIPCLPDTAPFTPEQRAYLNGFLAGLFSRAPLPAGAHPTPTAPATPRSLLPLTILFGSQTGNAVGLAKRVAKEAGKQAFAPTTFDLAQYPVENLKSEQNVLLITSTYGDGEPPDNAKGFWEFLRGNQAPPLPHLRFSVLALGDSNYEKFCQSGKDFDLRLEALGARRIYPRVDCDLDFDEPFCQWLHGALSALLEPAIPDETRTDLRRDSERLEGGALGEASPADAPPVCYSKANPFPARLITNRPLTAPGSGKETRHFEISLEGSGLNYEVGDALGVLPANCPELVEEIIGALGGSGEELVPGINGQVVNLREALMRHYEITKIPQPFLRAMAERSGDASLRKLAEPGVNGELTKFLWGREIIDLLLSFPSVKFTPAEFAGLLKKLPPRLYSIASSHKACPGQVHLTVGVVRYQSLGRSRKGVCSSFLADRTCPDRPMPIFVHHNKHFRLPIDGSRPVIMVGPGTGIAPFRAFLQERRAVGATGKNWLLFGEQHEKTDFLYRDELESMSREGMLSRISTAFSRDQEQKLYVQQRMLENARELYAWLEQGAHFYVCGDASRMAKDVDKALHQVIETGGGRTAEQAADYVKQLKTEKRYQRDVY